MKLVLTHNGTETVIAEDFDFETAYDWAMEHAENHDWSEEYDYVLTDDEGKVWHIEVDSWTEFVEL